MLTRGFLWHPQLHRLPRVLALLSIIAASGELGVTVAISDAHVSRHQPPTGEAGR